MQSDLQTVLAPPSLSPSVTKKEKKKSKSKKRGREDEEEEVELGMAVGEKGSEVAGLMLGALTKCCMYQEEAGLAATEGEGVFLTPARFEAVMPHVVGLVGGLRRVFAAEGEEGEGAYLAMAERALVPCLSQMAVAVGKDAMWKAMHHAVLMRTRDGDWSVRLVALQVLLATFTAVGEEYLSMLPESISYLSELMEDEKPEVVALCKRTIAYIEDLSGESLEEYLS